MLAVERDTTLLWLRDLHEHEVLLEPVVVALRVAPVFVMSEHFSTDVALPACGDEPMARITLAALHGVLQGTRGKRILSPHNYSTSHTIVQHYGTHHSVSKQYLQSYLDEFAFRYNHRMAAFEKLLERI